MSGDKNCLQLSSLSLQLLHSLLPRSLPANPHSARAVRHKMDVPARHNFLDVDAGLDMDRHRLRRARPVHCCFNRAVWVRLRPGLRPAIAPIYPNIRIAAVVYIELGLRSSCLG